MKVSSEGITFKLRRMKANFNIYKPFKKLSFKLQHYEKMTSFCSSVWERVGYLTGVVVLKINSETSLYTYKNGQNPKPCQCPKLARM